jgi:PAS domain-containing protein
LILESKEELNQQLEIANKKLRASNLELHHAQNSLSALNFELEARVKTRTEKLAESEARARYMLADSPVGIAVLKGKNLVIESVNDKMLSYWGKDRSILNTPLPKAVRELKNQDFFQVLQIVYQSGQSYSAREAKVQFEHKGVLREGYYSFVYHPLQSEMAKINSIMIVATDVTEQVLTRKALEKIVAEKTELELILKDNQSRLQYILDTMAEGVCIVNPLGKIVYTNAMAQKILRLSNDKYEGHSFYEFD